MRGRTPVGLVPIAKDDDLRLSLYLAEKRLLASLLVVQEDLFLKTRDSTIKNLARLMDA